MIYLAGPYTHEDPHVRHDRFRRLTEVAAALMARGINVYSPITHSHPMLEFEDLPHTWEFWENVDREYLKNCSLLAVCKLDGWEQSTGVNAEIKIAEQLRIPVRFASPDEIVTVVMGFTLARLG